MEKKMFFEQILSYCAGKALSPFLSLDRNTVLWYNQIDKIIRH
jgi:hypothetical protein